MRAINDAWAVLSDPIRRHRYDLACRGPDAVHREGGAERPPPSPARPRRPWVPLDDDDDDGGDGYCSDSLEEESAGGCGPPPRWIQVGPPLLLVVAVVALVLGGFTAIPGLVPLGVGCASSGLVLFLAAPLVTVRSTARRRTSFGE